jgi:hypothetical protein
MPNIKFNYLYRDGANYKNFSFVIFDNPNNVNPDVLLKTIKPKLIDETWFYVDQWNLPDLHFTKWHNEFDHTWHEFESIEYTSEVPNSEMTLAEFISLVQTHQPFCHLDRRERSSTTRLSNIASRRRFLLLPRSK